MIRLLFSFLKTSSRFYLPPPFSCRANILLAVGRNEVNLLILAFYFILFYFLVINIWSFCCYSSSNCAPDDQFRLQFPYKCTAPIEVCMRFNLMKYRMVWDYLQRPLQNINVRFFLQYKFANESNAEYIKPG